MAQLNSDYGQLNTNLAIMEYNNNGDLHSLSFPRFAIGYNVSHCPIDNIWISYITNMTGQTGTRTAITVEGPQRMFSQQCAAGVWHDWEEHVLSTNYLKNPGVATAENINDLAPGFYTIDALSIDNINKSIWGTLICTHRSSGDQQQTLFSNGSGNQTIFYRVKNNNVWGAWDKLVKNSDIDGKYGVIDWSPAVAGVTNINGNTVYKAGNVVNLSIKLDINNYVLPSNTLYVTFFNLPEGFRPNREVGMTIMSRDGEARNYKPLNMRITTSGAVGFRFGDVGKMPYIFENITFLV